jgi:hypothetical protein
LYVADGGHFLVRKISPKGEVRTLCGSGEEGFKDGVANEAKFGRLSGIAIDSKRNVYVSDLSNHLIRRITPTGDVTTFAGRRGQAGCADGPLLEATFSAMVGLCCDAEDHLWVADTGSGVIRKIAGGQSLDSRKGADHSLDRSDHHSPVFMSVFVSVCAVCCAVLCCLLPVR